MFLLPKGTQENPAQNSAKSKFFRGKISFSESSLKTFAPT
jgi:hypothetical protein